MDTKSKHVLAEYWDCDREILDDEERLEVALRAAAAEAGATVVQAVLHRYKPQGVSGVLVIEESHFSVHTWPEEGYVACDFFTCGSCKPERANEIMKHALQAKTVEALVLRRGEKVYPRIRVEQHAAAEIAI